MDTRHAYPSSRTHKRWNFRLNRRRKRKEFGNGIVALADDQHNFAHDLTNHRLFIRIQAWNTLYITYAIIRLRRSIPAAHTSVMLLSSQQASRGCRENTSFDLNGILKRKRKRLGECEAVHFHTKDSLANRPLTRRLYYTNGLTQQSIVIHRK